MKITRINFSALPLIVSAALLASCASQGDIDALKQGQDEIKKGLADIKQMIEKGPPGRQAKPFQPSDVTISGSPMKGNADAPVTLVEFTDYQCPFCKRHATTTMPEIVKNYVDTGKVRYVLRSFPLKSIHPNADKLAQAALCAGDQDKYWEMHDRLFSGNSKMDPSDFSDDIKAVKLNSASFKSCLDSGKYAKQIDTDIEDGSKLGVTGTPSFFLGKSGSGSTKFKATETLKGAVPYANFQQTIDKLLK